MEFVTVAAVVDGIVLLCLGGFAVQLWLTGKAIKKRVTQIEGEVKKEMRRLKFRK
jgi:hypothetical protein